MEHIRIQTTQNVGVQYRTASIGERMLAVFIDFGIMATYAILVTKIFGELTPRPSGGYIFILFSPLFLYHLISEIFMSGQSLGKKVLKIKVIRKDGSHPSVGNYFVRWIFRLIDINITYGSVAIITIAANGKGQRLGDLAAGTMVISVKDKLTINDTLYENLPENYAVKYEAVKFLSDKDIKTVKRVLRHYHRNISKPKAVEMLKKTARAIKQKTGIVAEENPGDFLRTVLKDYSAVHS